MSRVAGRVPTARIVDSSDVHLLSAIESVEPVWCDGHFPRFPALPVASMVSLLVEAAGTLFRQRNPTCSRYLVRTAQVHARELSFVGESLRMSAEYCNAVENGERYRCEAVATQSRSVGELEVVLEGV